MLFNIVVSENSPAKVEGPLSEKKYEKKRLLVVVDSEEYFRRVLFDFQNNFFRRRPFLSTFFNLASRPQSALNSNDVLAMSRQKSQSCTRRTYVTRTHVHAHGEKYAVTSNKVPLS